jgi:hypothetical protein
MKAKSGTEQQIASRLPKRTRRRTPRPRIARESTSVDWNPRVAFEFPRAAMLFGR